MRYTARKAIILGGTGVLGRAAARRLLDAGWAVDLVGRHSSHVPSDLTAKGARFLAIDRQISSAVGRVMRSGADLLVDALCYTSADAQQLLPFLGDVNSVVMLSSKAVYADAEGRHVNSERPPDFPSPIREDQPTVKPCSTSDYNSREGYAACKVAAEITLLDSGAPVTVIRASKVHGDGAPVPGEWIFVKRIIDKRTAVFLAHRGLGGNHTTAAVNTAALIERVAAVPGARILNSADPDAPNGLEIVRAIAAALDYEWQEILLDDDDPSGLGRHPWDAQPPIILDTRASLQLGYVPVGTYAETVSEAIGCLVSAYRTGTAPATFDTLFSTYVHYSAEDAYLASRAVPNSATAV
jgi:nucleoside-diphosphate-sugar epimerase